jgi:hypothetical protein
MIKVLASLLMFVSFSAFAHCNGHNHGHRGHGHWGHGCGWRDGWGMSEGNTFYWKAELLDANGVAVKDGPKIVGEGNTIRLFLAWDSVKDDLKNLWYDGKFNLKEGARVGLTVSWRGNFYNKTYTIGTNTKTFVMIENNPVKENPFIKEEKKK